MAASMPQAPPGPKEGQLVMEWAKDVVAAMGDHPFATWYGSRGKVSRNIS
jgi:hypothetical protein